MKYPFIVRLLEKKLNEEIKFMKSLHNQFDVNGERVTDIKLFPEWAKTNIDTCDHRIRELVDGIESIKNM